MGARTTLTDAWPLFGLRLRTDRLVLRLPVDGDLVRLLNLAKAGIHDPGTMPFGVAWSTVPSPAFERAFMQHHWGMRGSWSSDQWFLNLLVEWEGDPIGSQSIDATDFAVERTIHTGSWLGRAFQGRGFGKEMRSAVLGFGFDGLGARLATTEAFLDNAASNGVSRSLGYEPNGLGSLAPEGVARETQRFRMTAESWRSRPRPAVTIEGLDACRAMFGAE
jgi:RimJ/RimL family protein N-acetyltransferase